eukprot:3111568-Prymnesium_polylepis.1
MAARARGVWAGPLNCAARHSNTRHQFFGEPTATSKPSNCTPLHTSPTPSLSTRLWCVAGRVVCGRGLAISITTVQAAHCSGDLRRLLAACSSYVVNSTPSKTAAILW